MVDLRRRLRLVEGPLTRKTRILLVDATGGEVILVNHFSQEEGLRGFFERTIAPVAGFIGWRSVFAVDRVLVCEDLRLAERKALWPFGLFTMLRFVKQPGFGLVRQGAPEAASVASRTWHAGLCVNSSVIWRRCGRRTPP